MLDGWNWFELLSGASSVFGCLFSPYPSRFCLASILSAVIFFGVSQKVDASIPVFHGALSVGRNGMAAWAFTVSRPGTMLSSLRFFGTSILRGNPFGSNGCTTSIYGATQFGLCNQWARIWCSSSVYFAYVTLLFWKLGVFRKPSLRTWVDGFHLPSKRVYLFLLPARPRCHWYSVAWKATVFPRWTFILWLAMHSKLLTLDRAKFLNRGSICPLCQSSPESRNHLFFLCPIFQHI